MIIALDSYYKDDLCNTSLVLFSQLDSSTPIYTDTIFTKNKEQYIPGQFYKKELPGIKKILEKFKKENPIWWSMVDMIITDSYVRLKLGDKEWDGLGEYLNNWLKKKKEERIIIGVAKTLFGDCNQISEIITRGKSKTPLYIQSTLSNKWAANLVKTMDGNYRIPTMLKLVDQKSRNFLP